MNPVRGRKLWALFDRIAWGESTWRAGKIFAQMDTHHHGADHLAVWLPARPGVQEALVDEDPTQFANLNTPADYEAFLERLVRDPAN